MKDTKSISLSVRTGVDKTLKLKKGAIIHNYSRPILTTTTQTTYCLAAGITVSKRAYTTHVCAILDYRSIYQLNPQHNNITCTYKYTQSTFW